MVFHDELTFKNHKKLPNTYDVYYPLYLLAFNPYIIKRNYQKDKPMIEMSNTTESPSKLPGTGM